MRFCSLQRVQLADESSHKSPLLFNKIPAQIFALGTARILKIGVVYGLWQRIA
jgi:hypothetical protein